MPDEEPQRIPHGGSAVGTRGGLAIRSDFPVDGDYVVKVALTGLIRASAAIGNRGGWGAGANWRRSRPAALGRSGKTAPRADSKRIRLGMAPAAGRWSVSRWSSACRSRRDRGSIGVSFHRTQRSCRMKRCCGRGWRSTGPELAVELVTISGPTIATGSGRYALAAAHFRLPSSFRRGRRSLRATILLHAGAPRLPPAGHCRGCRKS